MKVTHLHEDRRAEVSPWGRGNGKIGPGVYTYSKTAVVSCPGRTAYCEALCYAQRMGPWVDLLHQLNTERGAQLPPLPDDARLVRGHVSGDFDSVPYVYAWAALAESGPDVKFWFYTRSWRVPAILPALEELRAMPNVQLWASMDPGCEDAPAGWPRAWMSGDSRGPNKWRPRRTADGVLAPTCPEQTGKVQDCEACGYCWRREPGADLVFQEH